MTTYGITGASGQLGRLVAQRLLELVDPADVVLLSRDPAKLAEFAARGAQTRAADFDDPATLPAAFAGIDRLLLVSTDDLDGRLAQQQGAVDAAAQAGVQRVAYTSLPRPDAGNPALVAPSHLGTEERLRASGMEWTMLRNNLYADMRVDALRQAGQNGALLNNAGRGRVALVTRADCADAAAYALVRDDAANQVYDITGPEALDPEQLAPLAERLSGNPVELVDLDDEEFVAALREAGLPDPFPEMMMSFGKATREGWLDEVTSAVRDLTGRDPAPIGSLI